MKEMAIAHNQGVSKCPYCKEEFQPEELKVGHFDEHYSDIPFLTFDCPKCGVLLFIKRA
jgi:hypothetical protein